MCLHKIVLGFLGSAFCHEKNMPLSSLLVQGGPRTHGAVLDLTHSLEPRSAGRRLTHISVHSRNKDPPPYDTEFWVGLLGNVVARAANTGLQQSCLFFRLNTPTPFNWSSHAFSFPISAGFHSKTYQLRSIRRHSPKSHHIRILHACGPLHPLGFNSAPILELATWQGEKSVPGAWAQRHSSIKRLSKIKTQAQWVNLEEAVLSSWLVLETQLLL